MARKKLKDMNLLDDFLFWALLSNKEYGTKAGKHMLEMILQRPVGEVTVHAQNAIPGPDESVHSIRLDAYITGTDTDTVRGDIYDLDPDQSTSDRDELPYRTRYYHAMIGNRCLESGKEYTTLRRAYVIIITSYDPFDRGRMMYTIKNRCLEEPDLPYEDGAATIYLYVNENPEGLPEDLVRLLRYMKETTRSNASDVRLTAIQDMVDSLKQDREVLRAEMWMEDIIRRERREEREEVEKEVQKKLEEAQKRIQELEEQIAKMEEPSEK